MSKISSEFIIGSAIGYFFANNILVFSLGVATGVVIQEKFGSVYKFSQFCYDSTIEIYKQQVALVKSKFNKNTNSTDTSDVNSLKNKDD